MLLADKVSSLEEGYNKAKEILRTDKVWETFLNVIELYGGDKNKIEKLVNNYDDSI